jgi:EcsC protein family
MGNDLTIGPPMTADLPDAVQTAIADIAQRHRAAGGGLMRLVNVAGGKIENRLELLPDTVKDRIEAAATSALQVAYGLAEQSHRSGTSAGSDILRSDRGHLALATLTGAAGGFGGIATALAELPVTTTVIFRAIQTIAAGHGFDPADPAVRAECLQVFAAGSPLQEDDGVNTSFLAARVTVTGPAIQRLIASVSPRFAALLGQKLAAQAVPVLGAITGAGINYAFMDYFQEMAHVRFGLMRLGQSHDPAAVATAFRAAVAQARISSG